MVALVSTCISNQLLKRTAFWGVNSNGASCVVVLLRRLITSKTFREEERVRGGIFVFFKSGANRLFGSTIRRHQPQIRPRFLSIISANNATAGLSSPTLNSSKYHQAWHNTFNLNFLSEATVDEKERWLTELLSSPNTYDAVDTEAYLVVLRALASSKLPDAPLRAERWVVRMEAESLRQNEFSTDRSSNIGNKARPTPECYECVIKAWADAMNEDPAIVVTRAERWLTKNLDDPLQELRPNTACFNAFLNACSKGRAYKGSHRKSLIRQHALKAERTLKYMIEDRKKQGSISTIAPNTESFNYVIRAWTRCRRSNDVADRAMGALSLLENYQESVDHEVGPDSKSYAMVMDSIAVRAKLKVKRIRSQKDFWDDPAKNGLNEIKLLNDIIEYMREKSHAGAKQMTPNTHTMNTIIAAWAHLSPIHSNATSEAEKILRQMISMKDKGVDEIEPDTYTYQVVMRAWKNSHNPMRGKRVAYWLNKQWKDFDFEGRPGLQPNTTSYNLVIRVWSDLGDAKQAERLLSELIHLSKRMDLAKIAPNSESYALVIRAWLVVAERGSREALITAFRWLKTLAEKERENDSALSQIEFYTAILGAARKCASQCPDVLDVAVETFDMLRSSHHKLDCIHYSRLLQAGILALSKPEDNEVRTAFIKQVVQECCEDGLVSSALLSALANGPVYYDGYTIEESLRMLFLLFPDWPLPQSWTRNIRQSEQIPKRSDATRTIFNLSRHGIDPYKK